MSSSLPKGIDEPKLAAAVKFLRRTGMREFQLRYSDDEAPVVWMAIAKYSVDENTIPVAEGGRLVYEVDASLDPLRATLRLCERMADGGLCTHCHRPTGFEPDSLNSMPLSEHVCWWQWDPELRVFRRGCE